MIHFNTGRHYSDKGQRIVACKLTPEQTGYEVESVHFLDVDRGINGYFLFPDFVMSQTDIMNAYDRGWYSSESVPQVLLDKAKELGWSSMFVR